MSYENLTITISDGKKWDEYTASNPKAGFYHLYGWANAIRETFGFKAVYLEARRGEKICGVLPLVLVNTFLGRHMSSIPIGVYAGVVADDEPAEQALVARAIELTKENKCAYLELRNIRKMDGSLPTKTLYSTFIRDLPSTKEECLERMPRKARASARHAIDNGLTYRMGLGQLEECYDIYAVNQRYLGSPVAPRQWFSRLIEIFKDRSDILTVRLRGKCVASVLTFFYGDTVLPFYGGCLPECIKLEPNNYMYLALQEDGVQKGFKRFDFGRSREGSGAYNFKINQGFEPTQLYYQYYLNTARDIPDVSPSNKSFSAIKTLWRHLPLPLTKWFGPKIFKFVIP